MDEESIGSDYYSDVSLFLSSSSSSSSSSSYSSCSSSPRSTTLGAFPVADGPLYRERNEFYKKLRKQKNRRAFSARCSRNHKENATSNRVCVLENTNVTIDGLTEEDIRRLLCSQRVVVQKNTSFQRAHTFRNPVRT